MSDSNENFFETLPTFRQFSGVADADNYSPLPESWSLAAADIVSSTKAIESGRYKAVNMAGASVISAVLNALGHRKIPFVFGGDGALLAVPEGAVEKTREALAAAQVWVKDELGLDLRAALIPMRDVRKTGRDVRVARFEVAPDVAYAMFTGGGASWAEAEMKAGHYAVPPAGPRARPDLTGLSCRWDAIQAKNGEIVSIIVAPIDAGRAKEFSRLVGDIVNIVSRQGRAGHPVPMTAPPVRWPPTGLEYELRASGRSRLALLAETLLGWVLLRTGMRLGRFDPNVYKSDVVRNSDFRKFDDGLKLTIDLAPPLVSEIECRLEEASAAGLCRYGLHRQSSALMTCIVPTPLARDHLHFIDGGTGGYAMAAANMKAKVP